MQLDKKEILRRVDHTLLSPTATWEDIRRLCDDAIAYETASVCIPPAYVKRVKAYVAGETDRLEELEQPRLPYDGKEHPQGQEDLGSFFWDKAILPTDISAI